MGIALIAAPRLFGFADPAFLPHLILGRVELGAALLTETVPSRAHHQRLA